MRKAYRRFLLVLFVLLLLNTSPALGAAREQIVPDQNSAHVATLLPDSNQVYQAIMAQQPVYPEGTPWGDDKYYESKGSGDGSRGYACHAFALVLSDAAFGNYSFNKSQDINNIRVGDILRLHNDTHSAIALRIDGNAITIAEGNYNHSVHWGRTVSRSDVNYYWTRYHDNSEFEPKPPAVIPVESVQMYILSTSLEAGKTKDISHDCLVYPTNATNKKLIWSSSNPNVATVDQNGVITGVGAGDCEVTATSEDGHFSDSCKVHVYEPLPSTINVNGLEITPTNLEVKVGQSATVQAKVLPENAMNKHVKWENDSSGVYSIVNSDDSHAEIKANRAGSAVLTVRTEDGNYSKQCSITVTEDSAPENTPTNPEESTQQTVYRLYNTGNLEHLYTTDAFEDRSLINAGWNDEGVGWFAPTSGTPVYRLYSPATRAHLYTSDSNEVQVLTSQRGWEKDKDGVPMFYSGGTIPVYRLYNENLKMHLLTTDKNEYDVLGDSGWNREGIGFYAKSLPNNQSEQKPDSTEAEIVINPSRADLTVGETQNFTATVNNASSESIHWRSTNPAVATVDNNGKVKALSTGLTWIYATTDSGLEELVPVTVIQGENVSGITGINFGPRDKNNNMPAINIKVKKSDLGKVSYNWDTILKNAFDVFWTKPTIYMSNTPNPQAKDYFELTDLENNCEKLFTFYSDEPTIASYNPQTKTFTLNGYGNALITLGVVGDPSVLSIRNVPNSFSGFVTIRVQEAD